MSVQSLLQGAYDLHVHGAPDPAPRRNNAFSLGRAGAGAGLAGMLLKEHTASTVGRCYVLNRVHDSGPRFFSSLVLNPTVGGLNPCAVEAALKAGAEVVFFPTYGAAHHIGRWGRGRPPTAYPVPGPDYPGLTVLGQSGRIKTECLAVCDLTAAHKAVLATGHLSPRESLLLVEAAAKRGVDRMVITHASQSITAMTVSDQRRAADLGAWIEHCFFAVTPTCPEPIRLEAMRDQIRAVGVGRCLLSSDFGQDANGPAVEGFAHHLGLMKKAGLTEEELRTLIKDNPERLMAGKVGRPAPGETA